MTRKTMMMIETKFYSLKELADIQHNAKALFDEVERLTRIVKSLELSAQTASSQLSSKHPWINPKPITPAKPQNVETWERGDVLISAHPDFILKFDSIQDHEDFWGTVIYKTGIRDPLKVTIGKSYDWQIAAFKKAVSNIETPSPDHVGRKAVVLRGSKKGQIVEVRYLMPDIDKSYTVDVGLMSNFYFNSKDLYLLPPDAKPQNDSNDKDD